jgi:hypothetical protein
MVEPALEPREIAAAVRKWAEGHHADAIAMLRALVAREPNHAQAWSTLAWMTRDFGQYDESLACCARALELEPKYAGAHYNEALTRLVLGDFALGWQKNEWRFLSSSAPKLPPPKWTGMPAAGQQVALAGEQGFGDMIQFVRYAALIARSGARVTVATNRPLHALFESADGVSCVESGALTLNGFHFYAPMLSLPFIFQTTIESIPNVVPYLHSEPIRRERWAAHIVSKKPRIGLTWSGSEDNLGDRERSISLRLFAPLLADDRFQFIRVQRDMRAGDEAVFRAYPDFNQAGAGFADFANAAAVIDQCDLVISVDTATAHLAGALGKPAWILLPFVPDWRWMLDREDSPWYPSARLFRQTQWGDWPSVIERVRAELGARFA